MTMARQWSDEGETGTLFEHRVSVGEQPWGLCARSSPLFYSRDRAQGFQHPLCAWFLNFTSPVLTDFVQAYSSCMSCVHRSFFCIFVAGEHECLSCYQRKTVCQESVTQPSVWEWGTPTRGLSSYQLDMVQGVLDTMGFFECPRLHQGLLCEYQFLPCSLCCEISPQDKLYKDAQGRALGGSSQSGAHA